ncbi:hypothetical protein [Schinkia azotoformans]|uniref:hypothetical protein n=1 Tax=Schinkia azotoformans TaxID=1454 RepID=UPI002DBD59DC|nr:hypothetical protein [Schinkia azotoformans]MEC1697762.1 hypothetical protein [Schinkia azotoformans]
MNSRLLEMKKELRIGLFLALFFINVLLMFVFGDSIWYLFFILAFVFLGLLIYTNIQYDKKLANVLANNLEETLIKNNFEADDSKVSDDFLTGIAINHFDNKFAILKRNTRNEEFTFRTFDFKDIVESSIKENGNTVTRTSKGAIVGGAVLAGGIGAVVGGLAGNKTSNEQVKKLTLSIVVDDLIDPVYDINFINAELPISKNNPLYENIYTDLNKWHKRISVILKRNETDSKTV